MIDFKTGDILAEDAEALVNAVNCVGIMGRGVALQFKQAFPENFKAYARACKLGEVEPGRMFVFDTGQLTHPRYIVNFPTKRHWRDKSRVDDIEKGLGALVAEVCQRRIRSIAIPPLGAGLGGLSWPDVRSRIERAFLVLPDVRVLVFEPTPASKAAPAQKARKIPAMTPDRYLTGLLDASRDDRSRRELCQ